MLAEFEQAKRELAEIKQELMQAREYGPNQAPETDFLKARALDLLKDIYGDSPSTLQHVKNLFTNQTTDAVLAAIDRALKAAPPLRRALGSEEDSRTMMALIEAAVWQSRIVRGASAVALLALIVIGITLGFDVAGLNRQADVVRKFFDDAKAQTGELQRQAADFEKNRKEISARIEDMQKALNSDSELNKLVGSFAAKLAQLKEIEQGWDAQKVAMANALSGHQSFLSNKEAEIVQQTSALLRHASTEVTTIEQLGQMARSQQSDITGLVDSAKRANEAIKAQAGDVKQSAERISSWAERVETQTGEVDRGATKLKTLQQDSEIARSQIETIKAAIDKRRTEVESAGASTLATMESTSKDYVRKATDALSSIDSIRSNATEYAKTVESNKNATIKQQQDMERLLLTAGQQETEITSRLEAIKTQQTQQKGELDRVTLQLDHANGIIKLVEDKRTEIGDKLHQMLDTAPSLDYAAAWKLVLASRVLISLAGAIALLLLVVVALVVALISARRTRTRIKTLAQAS